MQGREPGVNVYARRVQDANERSTQGQGQYGGLGQHFAVGGIDRSPTRRRLNDKTHDLTLAEAAIEGGKSRSNDSLMTGPDS